MWAPCSALHFPFSSLDFFMVVYCDLISKTNIAILAPLQYLRNPVSSPKANSSNLSNISVAIAI